MLKFGRPWTKDNAWISMEASRNPLTAVALCGILKAPRGVIEVRYGPLRREAEGPGACDFRLLDPHTHTDE